MNLRTTGLLILGWLLACTAKTQAQADAIRAALKSHDKAVLVKDDIWIRDPYIVLGPDDYYYLTGTTQLPASKLNEGTKYNVGLGDSSQVGWSVRVWKSKDLAAWEYAGEPFRLTDGYWSKKRPQAFQHTPSSKWHLWAPELHVVNGKWILLHTTPGPVKGGSNLAVTKSSQLTGPYDFPLGDLSAKLHDPSLFQDTDGKVYLIWGNTQIAELTPDLTRFKGPPQAIQPSTLREMPDGTRQPGIGHEGCTVLKIGNKYVLFGTGWSTNKGRRGSYNLYYAVAGSVKGPYGPRKFAGRFLGHGTPFRDREGRWWCTAFYNSNVPPLDRDGIQTRNLADNAYTINRQGITLVPLEVTVLKSGDIRIRAKDADYVAPGPDEVQQFPPDSGSE
ncbi:family 43 glycosylhydrolase [Niabella beijingensis]|uniref:family 43 glycosylhydrolase n=1 Tax=Niabella beijingensis TaxID=2872700 RepID=UPI001CBF5F6D|nr:family 43 glycosylhydrolase [Niabella beijingensis]MBZ4191952.1 family 43 glycosylhydrolase [Niabella beijingensis]